MIAERFQKAYQEALKEASADLIPLVPIWLEKVLKRLHDVSPRDLGISAQEFSDLHFELTTLKPSLTMMQLAICNNLLEASSANALGNMPMHEYIALQVIVENKANAWNDIAKDIKTAVQKKLSEEEQMMSAFHKGKASLKLVQ